MTTTKRENSCCYHANDDQFTVGISLPLLEATSLATVNGELDGFLGEGLDDSSVGAGWGSMPRVGTEMLLI